MLNHIELYNTSGELFFEHNSEDNTFKNTVIQALGSGKCLKKAVLVDDRFNPSIKNDMLLRASRSISQVLRYDDNIATDFIDVDMRGVNFSKSVLRGADFINSHLMDTNFSFSDLTGACFIKADLTRTDLRGACLDGADFRYCDLSYAKYYPQEMEKAITIGAIFTTDNE